MARVVQGIHGEHLEEHLMRSVDMAIPVGWHYRCPSWDSARRGRPYKTEAEAAAAVKRAEQPGYCSCKHEIYPVYKKPESGTFLPEHSGGF